MVLYVKGKARHGKLLKAEFSDILHFEKHKGPPGICQRTTNAVNPVNEMHHQASTERAQYLSENHGR